MNFSIYRLRPVLVALAVTMMGTATPLFAQQAQPRPATRDSALQAARDSAVYSSPPGAPLLDLPIERTRYTLGPNDVVDVFVFGALNRQFTRTITPEGTVVLPGIGFADVQGLTLEQAEARIRQLVLRNYRNVDVHLALSMVRRFNVFLVGDVPNPGVRPASAVMRLTELVEPVDRNKVARRNIRIRRSGGEILTVDLIRFSQLGDVDANPALKEGDAVFVPVIDRTVSIHGEVDFPGTYEYRPGETLAELLSIVTGGDGFSPAAADSIRIARFLNDQQRSITVLSRDAALGAAGNQIVLQPSDAVFVPSRANFREQEYATVVGQVRRPGNYPIHAGYTTARQLVEMAGGFTELASLVNAALHRRPSSFTARESELSKIPPELLTEEEQRILQISSSEDRNHLVIDFQDLFAGGRDALDQPLQTGDSLVVPRRRDEVVVLGAVRNPGIVRYAPGLSASDFVRLAGGFSSLADRGSVVVLKSRLGTRVDADEVRALDPGDTVIAPFRERRSFLDIVRDVSIILTPLSTIVLLVIAIDNANN